MFCAISHHIPIAYSHYEDNKPPWISTKWGFIHWKLWIRDWTVRISKYSSLADRGSTIRLTVQVFVRCPRTSGRPPPPPMWPRRLTVILYRSTDTKQLEAGLVSLLDAWAACVYASDKDRRGNGNGAEQRASNTRRVTQMEFTHTYCRPGTSHLRRHSLWSYVQTQTDSPYDPPTSCSRLSRQATRTTQ